MEKSHPPESIPGSQITLKRLNPALAQTMFEYIDRDRARLQQYLPWPKLIQTVADEAGFLEMSRQEWTEFKTFGFAIFRSSDDKYMGNISAFGLDWKHHCCEIGYWILGDFEGKGFMTDAAGTLTKTLFALGFNRVVIRCEPANRKSASVPRRLGFKLEGVSRQIKLEDGQYRDLENHSKLRSDA